MSVEAKNVLTGKIPTLPVVDKTLTRAGYSADAKVTGEAIAENDKKIDVKHEELREELDIERKRIDESRGLIDQIANNQIPEEYLEAAVDRYVEGNSAGFATQASLEAVETDLKSDLSNAEEKITANMKLVKSLNRWNKDEAKYGYVDPANGSIGTSSSYCYCEISVEPNDIIESNANMRFICAYDIDGNVVSSAGVNADVRNYVVPGGIYKLAITTYSSVKDSIMVIINGVMPTEYVPYEKDHYVATAEFLGKREVSLFNYHTDTFLHTILCSWGSALQKGLTVCASMDIGNDFVGALISFVDDDGVAKVTIRVTTTYIEIADEWFGTPVRKAEYHGLTFANNLQVFVRYDGTHTANVEFVSNGAKYTISGESIKLGHLKPALAVTGTATNIRFSVTCEDANKDSWMFGDSYFANYNTRWVSHLMNSEYKNNVLINAYSGENSPNAYADLEGLITQGTPKHIFWCLGMNDGSDADISTPSAAWLESIQKVIALCKGMNVTPILATIPTVPTVYNEGKNKWVRESGYQYVDFAKAVGATSEGEWYGEMLSSDGVHPSGSGAVALYYQVLTDFPQIMISN